MKRKSLGTQSRNGWAGGIKMGIGASGMKEHLAPSWVLPTPTGVSLQYSWLENLTDRGAWWATIQWAAKSRIQLKWLSTAQHPFWGNNHCLMLTWNQVYFMALIKTLETLRGKGKGEETTKSRDKWWRRGREGGIVGCVKTSEHQRGGCSSW